jgi:sec-independent protein translocase protein TatB
MFGLSLTHIIVLLVLALIFIGPDQLPEVARTIARFLNEIKRTTNVMAEDMKRSVRDENIRSANRDVEEHNKRILAEHPPAEAPIKDSHGPKDG